PDEVFNIYHHCPAYRCPASLQIGIFSGPTHLSIPAGAALAEKTLYTALATTTQSSGQLPAAS
ncbi:TPA: hypothetical protein IEL14_RS25705, partial [Escherichia coli]